MSKNAKIITVSNLKGGVGKSSLTSILASSLHQQDFKVMVIDADDLQHSVEMIRNRDLETTQDKDGLYQVLASNSFDAVSFVPQIIEDFDYIFIDLPGNFKQKGVIDCITLSDIIFIPTSLSDEDLDSTIRYLNILLKEVVPPREKIGLNTEIYGVLYKVSLNSLEFKEFDKNRNDYPIPFFKNVIPFSERLKRQSSTVGVLDYQSKSFNMTSFIHEFYKTLKLS